MANSTPYIESAAAAAKKVSIVLPTCKPNKQETLNPPLIDP